MIPAVKRCDLSDEPPATVRRLGIRTPEGVLRVNVIVDVDADGHPVRIDLRCGRKGGDSMQGFLTLWVDAVSAGLQHGIPLSVFVRVARRMRFPPDGIICTPWEGSPWKATSIPDLVAAWLEWRFSIRD